MRCRFRFATCVPDSAAAPPRALRVSTSTRNFPNRLGKGADVFLASAELATVAAITGKLPQPAEYLEAWKKIDSTAADTYRYLNFDTIENYTEKAHTVSLSPEVVAAAKALKQ